VPVHKPVDRLRPSGKSTIASALEERLIGQGMSAYRLDGDELRRGLSDDLGFAPADRSENVRRVAHVAALITDGGTLALVNLISPYAADRAKARAIHERAGLAFIEIYVNTPLEVCEQRDPKGMYAGAGAGDLEEFTGVDAPYESPTSPDVEVTPAETPLPAIVDQLMGALAGAGLI
jgi:adenylyl-sulfate kinase